MGTPEEKPKDESVSKKRSNSSHPELDAVLPDGPQEIINEFDAYQKRIEQDWEVAKKTYEKKIDQIMDDFVRQKAEEIEKAQKSQDPPPTPPKRPAPKEKPQPNIRSEADKQFEAYMEKARQTLQRVEQENKNLTSIDDDSDRIINATWHPHKPWYGRMGLFIGVGLALVSGLVGLGLYLFFQVGSVTELPYTHTYGISVTQDRVIIADWFRQALYVHKKQRGLPIESVEALPNKFVTGFTSTPKYFLSINGFSKELLQHTPTYDHRVIDKRDALGGQLAGLFWDGTHVWTFDNSDRVLYQLHGNDLDDVLQEFPLTEGTVTDFEIRDNRAWTLDGETREIFVYRIQDPLKQLGAFDLDPFIDGAKPTGLFVESSAVWVVTENPARVIKIPKRNLRKSNPNSF